MVTLTPQTYRDRVQGGWLGKLIGTAAGAPHDGQKRPLDFTDADDLRHRARPSPGEGAAVVRVWLEELRASGPGVSADDLVRAWLEQVRRAEDEYGYARANFRRDLLPPVSGVHDNPFRESQGALARADLWGLLAPGDPVTAAGYAWQEAMLDHSGTGVSAAVVLAGLVSAAFAEPSVERLVEVVLRLVGRESRIAQVVRDVARWHGELANWRRTREMVLRSYGSEDVRDSTVALAFTLLALLDGEGELGHSLLTAARCGWSTACVCGAVGAVVGAMQGAAQLPPRWREVLGETAGEAERAAGEVEEVGRQVVAARCDGRCQVQEEPPEEESRVVIAEAGPLLQRMAMGPYVVSFSRGPLEVLVDYEQPPTIGYDLPRRLSIGLVSHAARDVELHTRFTAPEGFVVIANTQPIALPEEGMVSFAVSLTAPPENCEIAPVNQCVLFLSIEEEPELAVPITLAGESIWFAAGPYGDFGAPHPPERPALLAGQEALVDDTWQRLSVSEPAVNVLAGLEGEQGTYYLATDLVSPGAFPARLRVGCNDGVRIWQNGREVFSQHEHRPADARVSADECLVELAQGWNRLVIKMAQCSPRRFLSVALRDQEGHHLIEVANTRPR